MEPSIEWDKVVKKEVRGSEGNDFGEVQEVNSEYVITQKGIVDRKWYQIPKSLVKSFDGDTVFFNVTEEQTENFVSSAGRGYERI
jgi:hypothetical protein